MTRRPLGRSVATYRTPSRKEKQMNLLFPHMTQFEESQRNLERDFRLRQQIRAARGASYAKRTSRFGALATRVHRAMQPEPCSPHVEDC
jgi:hypothetical protein